MSQDERLFIKLFNIATNNDIFSVDDILDLSYSMIDTNITRPQTIGSNICAGYTYLGQWFDHEITREPTTNIAILQKVNVDLLINGQSSLIELDSLYGKNNELLNNNGEFPVIFNAVGAPDLPRNPVTKLAIIGDPRNEENLLVANIHVSFLLAHNKIIREIKIANQDWTLQAHINEAKKQLTYIVQWILAYNFLQVMTSKYYKRLWNTDGTPKIHKEILKAGLKMPIEFATAYRFGHSLVRDNYYVDTLHDVLQVFDVVNPGVNDLSGFRPLPNDITISPDFFFPMPNHKGCQVAELIDGSIANTLATLPGSVIGNSRPVVLHSRSLLRSTYIHDVISGQDMARLLDISDDEIISAANGRFQLKNYNANLPNLDMDLLTSKFGNNTPLFLYILKEAEVFSKGECLGPLGSLFIGGCFLHFINNTPINIFKDNWIPVAGKYGCIKNGIYDMTALMSYAHDVQFTTYDEVPIESKLIRNFDQHSNNVGQFANVETIAHPLAANVIGAVPDIFINLHDNTNPYFNSLVMPAGLLGLAEIPGQIIPIPTTEQIANAQTIIDNIISSAIANQIRPDLSVYTFIINHVINGIATGLFPPLDGPIENPIIAPFYSNFTIYYLIIKDANNNVVKETSFVARNGEMNNISLNLDLSGLNVNGPLSYELSTDNNLTFLKKLTAIVFGF